MLDRPEAAARVAERMKFSAFMLFCALWLFIVYVPSAHGAWGGGCFQMMGLLDFAGGTVVHINAGVAGLVCALVLGSRVGFGRENLSPFDLSLAVVGRGCSGSAGSASTAVRRSPPIPARSLRLWRRILPPARARSCGAAWNGFSAQTVGARRHLGSVAGSATTPASGYVLPWHGVVIGMIAGGVLLLFCTVAKYKFRYDDTLDVFGVHGVGDVNGTLLAGVFATRAITASEGDPGVAGLLEGDPHQLYVQAIGAPSSRSSGA